MNDSVPTPEPNPDVFSKPAGDPNPLPADTDLVRRAVLQLRGFGDDLNQGTVRRLLPYWRHFRELSAQEMLAVVDQFPDGPAGDDTEAGVIMPGGGWISGPQQGGES